MPSEPKNSLSNKLMAVYGFGFIGLLILAILFTQPSKLERVPYNAVYKQDSQPTEVRIADLLSRMTLEEKIGQMALVDKNSLHKYRDAANYNLGGVLSGAGAKPADNTANGWRDMVNEIKNQAQQSRLAIPIFYGIDANHGHSNVPGAVVFPHNIGLGASGNEDLVKKIASATAEELSATGINWTFSPNLDAPKDIRWGRVYESFSDNPELNARLGASYIQGTKAGPSKVLTSAKHYLGSGSMIWGSSKNKNFKIDQGVVAEDEVLLDKYFLPPFKSAISAGVSSIMVSLNYYGNQRTIDNKHLLTDKLKNELGFKGFVVSDWYGVYEFSGVSDYSATVKTINAGVDMAMLPFDYKSFIYDVRLAVKKGDIAKSRIDDAASRILRQKFENGLFDLHTKQVDLSELGSDNNRALARRAVAESAVLLKNNGRVLPLNKNDQILIAGSASDNVGRQSGAWTVEWQGIDGNWLPGSTSILSGLKAVSGKSTNIKHQKDGRFNLSAKAKVGIVVVSEKPYAEGWGDNPNPTLSSGDITVINNLRTQAEKLVIVVVSGRPLLMGEHILKADAVVAAWLPGSEGAGLADVLFGDMPFSAKLPLPWPAGLNQLPINTDGTTKDMSNVLFPRSFGLSAN